MSGREGAATLTPKTPLISVEQWSEQASSPRREGRSATLIADRPEQGQIHQPNQRFAALKSVFYHQSTTKMEAGTRNERKPRCRYCGELSAYPWGVRQICLRCEKIREHADTFLHAPASELIEGPGYYTNWLGVKVPSGVWLELKVA